MNFAAFVTLCNERVFGKPKVGPFLNYKACLYA